MWASLAQSPAAELFLTPKQMRQTEANTLAAHPMDHRKLQEEENGINIEIKSINDQIQEAQNFINTNINNNINTLKQKYPTSFVEVEYRGHIITL